MLYLHTHTDEGHAFSLGHACSAAPTYFEDGEDKLVHARAET